MRIRRPKGASPTLTYWDGEGPFSSTTAGGASHPASSGPTERPEGRAGRVVRAPPTQTEAGGPAGGGPRQPVASNSSSATAAATAGRIGGKCRRWPRGEGWSWETRGRGEGDSSHAHPTGGRVAGGSPQREGGLNTNHTHARAHERTHTHVRTHAQCQVPIYIIFILFIYIIYYAYKLKMTV